MQDDRRALHAKLRRATLAEHLGEEHGSREVSTQTELAPGEAITPSHFRSQSTAQTPRQRAESVLQAQAKVCLANPSTPIHSWHPVLLNLGFFAASQRLQPPHPANGPFTIRWIMAQQLEIAACNHVYS